MMFFRQLRTERNRDYVPSCGTNSGLIDQTGGQGQQTRRHDLLLASRGSTRIVSRLGSSAVGPSALTVPTSPRSRRRNPLPFSDAPGWAIDIEAGRWAARPTCHGSPAHPQACASLAVDRPIWSFVAARQCVVGLSSKLNPIQAGR
jgi:hypothetical protein